MLNAHKRHPLTADQSSHVCNTIDFWWSK